MPVSTPAPASALLTPRQYLHFAILTGLAVSLLDTPGLLAKPGATVGYVAVQIGRILLFTAEMFGLNYYLRYGPGRTQHWLRRQPVSGQKVLHIALNPLVAVLTAGLLRVGVAALGYPDQEPWSSTLLSSVLFSGIILGIQAFISLRERSKYLAQEIEQFKLLELQARYESLKQQLSPHFLFNSLATLGELIYDEPATASLFVEEMAQVYHYLLHHSERPAVPLGDELSFLQSYAFLLQMRFGESFVLHLDVPEDVMTRLVPPLALQTLVENAIKHNVIGRQQPMHLYVELRPPDYLQVRNACHPRQNAGPSSGTGLHNLANRVRLLHRSELLIEHDTEFRVSLPLPANADR